MTVTIDQQRISKPSKATIETHKLAADIFGARVNGEALVVAA